MLKSKQDWQHLYKTTRWQRMRQHQLQLQPLCQISLALGLVVVADVVDHIRPHKGDIDLFFDPDNLQSVSKQMHDTICQQMENGTWQPPMQSNGRSLQNEYLIFLFGKKRPRESIF